MDENGVKEEKEKPIGEKRQVIDSDDESSTDSDVDSHSGSDDEEEQQQEVCNIPSHW